ncbi:MAG: hypothetical protein V4598_04255 [Bdellovibrionota bacterium]
MKSLLLLTILISLPLGAQITNSGTPAVTPSTTPITTPSTTPVTQPGVTNTGFENTGTGSGTGTGFAPIAPANPGNTPAATNPDIMNPTGVGTGWQGK